MKNIVKKIVATAWLSVLGLGALYALCLIPGIAAIFAILAAIFCVWVGTVWALNVVVG